MSYSESCIAAVIACTMMAISTPSLVRARQTYRLQAAARQTVSMMQSARIAAITRNCDCRLQVTSLLSYVVECQTGSWQVIDRVTVPQGITVSANNSPEFHRRGNVSPTATFTLRDMSGRMVRVIVNVNGRVRLQ